MRADREEIKRFANAADAARFAAKVQEALRVRRGEHLLKIGPRKKGGGENMT